MKKQLVAVMLAGATIAWLAGNAEAASPIVAKPAVTAMKVTPPPAPAPVKVAPQPKQQAPAPQPKPQPIAVQPKAASVQVSLQTTSSVNVGPASVTKSCNVATQQCTKSISGTALGFTASVAGNGDICAGLAQKGGIGVLNGKASETGCLNVNNGSIAVKGSVSGGAGLGVVGSAVGVTGTIRVTPAAPPANPLSVQYMTTGLPSWYMPAPSTKK